ncbi:MAG: hypothetical protein H0V44_01985 [Planctomycetes bacterium]|nr:hypothetical protein [Planctomycetota bacterium]
MAIASSTTDSIPVLSSCGIELDAAAERFGGLRSSAAQASDSELQARMEDDGYLYLPGALDRDQVLAARADLLRRLAEAGALDPEYAVEEGIPRAGASGFRPDLAMRSPELAKVLYDGAMMELFARLFAGPVRHYDFTWLPDNNGQQWTHTLFDISSPCIPSRIWYSLAA